MSHASESLPESGIVMELDSGRPVKQAHCRNGADCHLYDGLSAYRKQQTDNTNTLATPLQRPE